MERIPAVYTKMTNELNNNLGQTMRILAESIADLATRRDVQVWLGSPVEVLSGRRLAATFTPVPGWRSRAARLDIVATYPWPWLERPHTRSVTSYTAWRRSLGRR